MKQKKKYFSYYFFCSQARLPYSFISSSRLIRKKQRLIFILRFLWSSWKSLIYCIWKNLLLEFYVYNTYVEAKKNIVKIDLNCEINKIIIGEEKTTQYSNNLVVSWCLVIIQKKSEKFQLETELVLQKQQSIECAYLKTSCVCTQ